MAADQGRNFRSYYYEKVGFRGVEEKKSLEILLKEQPIDVIKLRQFCLRFPVPAVHRIKVWKILLGILPTYTENHQWVWEQRCQQFDDLTHTLDVTGHSATVVTQAEKLLLVWLLEHRNLHYDYRSQFGQLINQSRLAILNTLLKLFEQEADCYWLARGMFTLAKKFDEEQAKLNEQFRLKFEVEDQVLYKHMTSLRTLEILPLNRWFCSCFAGYIIETSLVRIWDKLVSGTGSSAHLLVFLVIALLIHFRHTILQSSSNEEIMQCLTFVSKEASEMVVNEAIELWQEHGGSTGPAVSEPSKK